MKRIGLGSALYFFSFSFVIAKAEDTNPPFVRDISLLGGLAHSRGPGVENAIQPALGFFYARSFSAPQPEHFLLRVIADGLWTHVTPSDTKPLAHLAESQQAQALLVRFGFSGCYLWSFTNLICLDDGPRISWLSQGKNNAQNLGSFPLGLSYHNAKLLPWIFMSRIEFGRWSSRENGSQQHNALSFLLLGFGYQW